MGSIRLGGVLSIDSSLQEVRIAFFLSLFFAVTLYALFRGGAPERSVAWVYLSMWMVEQILHTLTPPEYAGMDPWHLAVALILWIAFLAIALRAKRIWPLWIVSLETIVLIAHAAKFMDVSIHPRAYLTMQVASSYPILIALAVGTYQHQRRLKANGTDPSWRKS
jgi:hypothetical protein